MYQCCTFPLKERYNLGFMKLTDYYLKTTWCKADTIFDHPEKLYHVFIFEKILIFMNVICFLKTLAHMKLSQASYKIHVFLEN